MKKILLLTLLFSCLSFAQNQYNSKNITVTKADLELNTYTLDSTANAVVLYEYGKTRTSKHEDGLIFEFKQKIKILNKKGFDQANIAIYLYNTNYSKEVLKDIKATTYNLDNEKIVETKLSESNVFENQLNINNKSVNFTLPNIKEGSVITISYRIESPFLYKFKEWEFQSNIPKIHSEYVTFINTKYAYNTRLVGLLDFTFTDSKKCYENRDKNTISCLKNTYIIKDVPAFIEEDHMTSKYNFLSRLDFELKHFNHPFYGRNFTENWETADKEFEKYTAFGKQIDKKNLVKDVVPKSVSNITNLLEKATSIYTFVQENYSWNNYYNLLSNVSIKRLLKEKSGNVSEINLLLCNVLNENNITAKPIILSTRDNGLPTKLYPVITDFNYLIIQATIGDKTYLLDATDKYLSFGQIPFRCLNSYGRLIDFKNGSKWIDIKPNESSTTFYEAKLKINETGLVSGTIESKRTNYQAYNFKKEYYKDQNSYLNNLKSNHQDIVVSDFEVASNGTSSNVFKESYNIEYNQDSSLKNIYLNPFLVEFYKNNPFNLEQRNYPIDFGYKNTYFYNYKLTYDSSYAIKEKPEQINISLPNNKGKITLSSTILANSISLILRIDFEDSLYPAEYYPYLKEFMSRFIDIQNNTLIVLEKTK